MPEHTPAPTPSRAVYGFAMFLFYKISFLLYLLWALIPEEYFRFLGITCLPQPYWAIAVPIFLLTVLTLFAFIIYPSLGLIMTPSVNDLRTIQDKVGEKRKLNGSHLIVSYDYGGLSKKCVCSDDNNCLRQYYLDNLEQNNKKCVPALRDLNVWDVSRHLHLKQ